MQVIYAKNLNQIASVVFEKSRPQKSFRIIIIIIIIIRIRIRKDNRIIGRSADLKSADLN